MGDLDPSGTTYAFAKAARHYGAQYFTIHQQLPQHSVQMVPGM